VSLAEAPHFVRVLNPTGPYGNTTDDKPFLHKRGGVYYLSWGCFYAMGASPYGPFTYAGSVVDTANIAPDFRMNDTAGPWYGHQDYADRHGSFWSAHGQVRRGREEMGRGAMWDDGTVPGRRRVIHPALESVLPSRRPDSSPPQWYWSANDRSHSADKADPQYYRDTM
jgi:hypothetical protein